MPPQTFPAGGNPITGRVTPAAFPFYTTGEDNLRIVSFNSAPGVALKLAARLLGNDGRPAPGVWDHTPNTDRSLHTDDFGLSGQTLLNLLVSVASGAPVTGQTFVIVQLIRGLGTAAIVLGTIASGYVTPARAIGWPGSPLESPLDSGGFHRVIVGTKPAAGAEVSETCPTGARWEVESITIQLTTAAAAGNRYPSIIANVGGQFLYGTFSSQAQAASLNWFYLTNAGTEFQADTVNGRISLPLAQPMVLSAGERFVTSTIGMAGADQYQAPLYGVREWLEP